MSLKMTRESRGEMHTLGSVCSKSNDAEHISYQSVVPEFLSSDHTPHD